MGLRDLFKWRRSAGKQTGNAAGAAGTASSVRPDMASRAVESFCSGKLAGPAKLGQPTGSAGAQIVDDGPQTIPPSIVLSAAECPVLAECAGGSSQMAAPHLQTGNDGEDVTAFLLGRYGLEILARNWRPASDGHLPAELRGLELDIVAKERDTLVFVEVKTRSQRNGKSFSPLTAFTAPKQAKLRRAIAVYLEQHNAWDAPCRVDLACVRINGDNAAHVEYFTDVLHEGAMF